MRISDWSSDVCSSDLLVELGRFDFGLGKLGVAHRPTSLVAVPCASDAVSATLKQLRHRPAPPPGHPTPVSYGWPGGGAGRRRFSKADKDSNQARRVCQRADLPAASRSTTSRLFKSPGAPPLAAPLQTRPMLLARSA